MILITNDLFDIAWRLRAVNDDYRVYYNSEKSRYEVRDCRTKTLQFVVTYDELDARTVEYSLYSRVENAECIFAEIERYNAKLYAQLGETGLRQLVTREKYAVCQDAFFPLRREEAQAILTFDSFLRSHLGVYYDSFVAWINTTLLP